MTHERMLHILTLVDEYGAVSYREGLNYHDSARASSLRTKSRSIYEQVKTLLNEEVAK